MLIFGWFMLVVWVVGILTLVYRLHIPAMRHELEGLGDHIWSLVICITWPLWGLVMVYYRYKKPCSKVED